MASGPRDPVVQHCADPAQARRVELILHQLDALPTLGAVAARLLELTTAEDAEAREVIDLISSDPALASRVLKMCRCHARGRASDVQTVERAVLLLGFDAVRSAVLSVQVFGLFNQLESPGGETRPDRPSFQPRAFWQHSMAVATAAELLAGQSHLRHHIQTSEAFIAGLLHDLGQLALHVLLPQSFDRVCELAESHGITVDAAASQLIGIDTATTGKRLAEHWKLPEPLADVMWLHSQPIESLPDLEHRNLVGLIRLADAIVRQQHIAPLGHRPRNEHLEHIAAQLGIEPPVVRDVVDTLHTTVTERAQALGLDFDRGDELLLQSISRANEVLGRINATLQVRAAAARRQARTIAAIRTFHEGAAPGGTVVNVSERIVKCAANAFKGATFAMLYRAKRNEAWQFFRFADDGRVLGTDLIPAAQATALPDGSQISGEVMAIMPDVQQHLGAETLPTLQMLALPCGWGASAVLLHDCPIQGPDQREQLEALSWTWAAALTAAAQHEDVAQLSEQLAKRNRELLEAHESLARTQTLAAVGEIAAGAAHEMNNPLCVISGRAQLLANRLLDPETRPMAEQIAAQAHRLSDIITALRMFAEPTRPHRLEVDLGDLVVRVVQDVKTRGKQRCAINTVLADGLPRAYLDPEQISSALSELVRNAIESEGCTQVEVRVQLDAMDGRLLFLVTDDGSGLSRQVLAHAFDPFFSAKAAGRQPGLGLAQARRLVEAHGGRITLENRPSGGAIAAMRVPLMTEPADDTSSLAKDQEEPRLRDVA